MYYSDITIDENEARLKKEPTNFQKLTYDNIDNKLLDMIDRIGLAIKKLDDDVAIVNKSIDELESKYENDGTYLDYIEDSRSILNNSIDGLLDVKSFLLRKMKQNIEELEDQDNDLIDLLNVIDNKLSSEV